MYRCIHRCVLLLHLIQYLCFHSPFDSKSFVSVAKHIFNCANMQSTSKEAADLAKLALVANDEQPLGYLKCADCGKQDHASKMTPKGRSTLICGECNNLSSRIQRLNNDCKYRLKELTGEEIQAFRQKAKNLCGPDLVKEITETCIMASLRRSTFTMSKYGELEPKDVLEKKYKEKPQIWQNILDNAYSIPHPVTKEIYMWIPKLSISETETEENTETRTRRIESVTNARPKKAPKVNKRNQSALTEEGETGDAAVTVDLTEGMVTKIQALVVKMQEVQLTAEKDALTCVDKACCDYIPQNIKDILDTGTTTSKELIVQAEKVLEVKKVEKGHTKDLTAKLKECECKLKGANKTIKAILKQNGIKLEA